MKKILSIIEKKENTDEEINYAREYLKNKKEFLLDEIKSVLIVCKNISWNPFDYAQEENIFFVYEKLVFKNVEPKKLESIFNEFSEVSLNIKTENGKNKVDGFAVKLNFPNVVEKYLRTEFENINRPKVENNLNKEM